jgi:hypothetical protein
LVVKIRDLDRDEKKKTGIVWRGEGHYDEKKNNSPY